MRMILTDAITHDASRFLVRTVPVILEVIHRVEHVGERASDHREHRGAHVQ